MDKEVDPASSAGPAPLEQVRQSIHSDLQYISIQLDGKTYGGWYRLLTDGRMELLALANMHCERRDENTPTEQARGMLADFIRAARPAQRTRAPDADTDRLSGRPEEDRRDSTTGTTGTLGDLLYADKTKIRVSETDWVDLVHSIAARDQSALRALYEHTHRVVFTLLMRLTNNRDTAEELTLHVFHEVWRRAHQYDRANESVLGWIMNQARSSAIDHLERRQESVGSQADSPLLMTAASSTNDVSDLREQGRPLQDALTILTPLERQLIETAFFSELSYAEVATRLHQPLRIVRTSIRSGLGKLQHAMSTETIEEVER